MHLKGGAEVDAPEGQGQEQGYNQTQTNTQSSDKDKDMDVEKCTGGGQGPKHKHCQSGKEEPGKEESQHNDSDNGRGPTLVCHSINQCDINLDFMERTFKSNIRIVGLQNTIAANTIIVRVEKSWIKSSSLKPLEDGLYTNRVEFLEECKVTSLKVIKKDGSWVVQFVDIAITLYKWPHMRSHKRHTGMSACHFSGWNLVMGGVYDPSAGFPINAL
ncbi:hypothetical protein EV363DRAFT_1294611 [Boletus edulis]|nr:hypothetical protein EV363DRAFT_1294611 [Boletus edulis]